MKNIYVLVLKTIVSGNYEVFMIARAKSGSRRNLRVKIEQYNTLKFIFNM